MNNRSNSQGGHATPVPGNPNEQFSWRSSLSQPSPIITTNIPPRRSLDSALDPRLREELQFSPQARPPQSQVYSPVTLNGLISQSPTSQSQNTSMQFPPGAERVIRHLPPQNVVDETFDDAYATFILFCNPSIPSTTAIEELKLNFRAPPKSDGKSFSTFVLFQLIKKLESKELKTWAQLAIELGVELPNLDKGQSAQKVQQYAVRLKRWMRAMHVDAFFEYLLNKPHVYWTQIPGPDEPQSESGRDGVIPDEDLALRALLPETRPKRGRRKAEEKDLEGEDGPPVSQRMRLTSPSPSDEVTASKGAKLSSFPPNPHQSGEFETPWSAVEPRMSFSRGQDIQNSQWDSSFPGAQWRPKVNDGSFSQVPQSAITMRSTDSFAAYADEPQSAVTTSKFRSRRRHGPAVSSAWPSTGNASAGKLRGRPPSNRNVSDGPFSTFPVNPNASTGPPINLRENPINTPVFDNSEHRQPVFDFPAPLNESQIQRGPPMKPTRLSLQVPERIGGSVRLATPPPTVLVNGENLMTEIQNASKFVDYLAGGPQAPQNPLPNNPQASDRSYHTQMSPPTQRRLATDIQSSAAVSPSLQGDINFRLEEGRDRTNIDVMEHQFINKVLGADWFDHLSNPIERCSLDEADQIVKQTIRNLRQESPSKETFLINVAALAGGGSLLSRMRMTRLEPAADVVNFDAKWTLKFGAVEGSFNIRVQVPKTLIKKRGKGEDIVGYDGYERAEDEDAGTGNEEWKRRYVDLQKRITERDEKIRGLKTIVMNALVASQELNII